MKKITRFERGQALIIIVFSIIALVGAVALAIDGGNVYAERRRAQNAADAAALAGAVQRINNNSATWPNAVFQSALQNGYNNDGVTNTVSVYSPPISGPNAGNIEYIQVLITSHTKTYFASVLGISNITNNVEAVTRTKPSEYLPILDGAAVASLAPISDCDNFKSFWVLGEATLDLTGGGIFVNSNNPTCALITQGNGSIRIRDNNQIRVVGGSSIQKPKLLTPFPPIQTPPVSSPPPFYMPKVGCGNQIATVEEDGHTMKPGSWGDPFPPTGVTNLSSGVYCLDDGFTMDDGMKLSGNQVVFKITNGRVRFSGHAELDLSAPGSGQNAGLLIYQPQDNMNRMSLNANAFSSFRGTILAPGALIIINGNASPIGFHSQIIGNTIQVNGQDDIIFKIIPDQNYKALTFPQVQFTK